MMLNLITSRSILSHQVFGTTGWKARNRFFQEDHWPGPAIRHFDTILLNKLAALGSRKRQQHSQPVLDIQRRPNRDVTLPRPFPLMGDSAKGVAPKLPPHL